MVFWFGKNWKLCALLCLILQPFILTSANFVEDVVKEEDKHLSTYGWKSLEILLLRGPEPQSIPPQIFHSLVSAMYNLNHLVYVRDEFPPDQTGVKTTEMFACSGQKSLHSKTENILVQGFQPEQFSFNYSLDPYSQLNLPSFGNFLLIIQTDQTICKEDKYLLAAAAPCLNKNQETEDRSVFGIARPLLGKLIICLQNKQWPHFNANYDLFRHEIFHALVGSLFTIFKISSLFYGFGLVNPDKKTNVVLPKTIYSREKTTTTPYSTYFMDFAMKAKEYAKEHFGCEEIHGIEAEDANKIHLSEYIFGNELMTPVINNGANYFTHFSASILEETYRGNSSWYLTNRNLVDIESKHYWWGRQAGCAFLTNNCFELIYQAMHQNQAEYDKSGLEKEYAAGNNDWRKKRSTAAYPLPLCDDYDYLLQLTANFPKKICFSNGTDNAYYFVHCQLVTNLKIRPQNYEPISLQSQFPQVESLLNESGDKVYGSDYDHRYCPLPRAVTEGELENMPWNARIVPCQ